MRTYHPESWSYQAREMCNKQIWQVAHYENYTISNALHFFNTSYRHPMIVNRAAKRFGRIRRRSSIGRAVAL